MNRSVDAREYSAEELSDRVFAVADIEGITLSGGDPMDQPLDELLKFVQTIKSESDLSVMCYTGRTMNELVAKQDPVIDNLIGQFDLLIDGLYEHSRNDGSTWRGSSNQRIWYLSSRYQHLQESIENQTRREIEIEVGADNELTIAGIPPQGFMRNLSKNLASRGMQLNGHL